MTDQTSETVMLGRGLTQRELDALAVCLHHRLLLTDQLHELLAPDQNIRSTQRLTRRLLGGGLLGNVLGRGSGNGKPPRVWYVTEAGRTIAQPMVPQRAHAVTPDRASNVLQRHTLIANAVGIAFCRHGARLGHQCGIFDWDHEICHRVGTGNRSYNLVTDLVVRTLLHDPEGALLATRFVEIDRGTYSPLILRNKIRSYVRFLTFTAPPRPGGAAQPMWRSIYQVFPKLLVVFADQPPPLLKRRIDVLIDLCAQDPAIAPHLHTLEVGCALLEQVLSEGPYAPIWRTPRTSGLVDLLGDPPSTVAPEAAGR